MYYFTKYGWTSQGKNIQKLDRLSLLTSMFTKTYDDVSYKIFSLNTEKPHIITLSEGQKNKCLN